jgi:hypothetical protein
MAQHALIPSTIKFSFDSTLIHILDAQLSLSFQNGSKYQECMSKNGIKSYVLAKGNYVTQNGDIAVEIVKTPDGNQDASIRKIEENLEHIQKNDSPKAYTKSVTAVIENSGGEKFLDVSFHGYASEFVAQAPDSTNYLTYKATFVVFDPQSIRISN